MFDDPYGDDFEEEDTVSPTDDSAIVNDPLTANGTVVFRPGRDKLADGETLVCDETAYDMFYRATVEWPAMTFDFIANSADGAYCNLNPNPLAAYPLTITMVVGTQALASNRNKLVFTRMSNLHRTNRSKSKGIPRVKPHRDSDDDSSSSDEDEDDDDEEEEDNVNNSGKFVPPPADINAILQSVDVRTDSTVNRIRVMPQRANVVAYHTESGRLNLLDGAPALDSLNLHRHRRMPAPDTPSPSSLRPFHSTRAHGAEGFALDWSRVTEGRLVSGSCNGRIYLSQPSSSTGAAWTTTSDSFRGHKTSVEDLQWSPNEAEVFASCSCDQSICIFDARQYRKAALTVPNAHPADVNVISWNRNETHLLLSGGDEGGIKVWDLRNLNASSSNGEKANPAAEFTHHQKPITAVQWHPTDASMLCASSEDDSVTVWDLAVERDAEEELREGVVLAGAEDFPPQLLFIHMGQKDVKDVQWHPACSSLLASTAYDGINLFQPSNVALPT